MKLQDKSLDELQCLLKYNFNNRSLLVQALTRRSAIESGILKGSRYYQTLAILGDKAVKPPKYKPYFS